MRQDALPPSSAPHLPARPAGRSWRGLVLLLALALPVVAGGPAAGTVQARHLRPDGHVALAWQHGGTTEEYRAQLDRMAGVSVVSPTWFHLDRDDPGAVESTADPALVHHAHDRGVAVWPLLGNHIDPDLSHRVLSDPALRGRLAHEVAGLVTGLDADGINVDFENLRDETAPLVTQLLHELRALLGGRIVSVDVGAMTDTYVLGNWSTAYDRAGFAAAADYVVLMAYDQHNTLRRNGPVAGLDWVAESVEFLLRTVPADRLVLGIPLYSRDWADDPTAEQGVALDATLGMAAMGRRLAERSQGVVHDAAAGMDLHTYVDAEGRPHRVWHEDEASIARKVALVGHHGLAGVAAWRAGFEDPSVWTVIDAGLRDAAAAPDPAPSPAPPTAPAGSDGPPVADRPEPTDPPREMTARGVASLSASPPAAARNLVLTGVAVGLLVLVAAAQVFRARVSARPGRRRGSGRPRGTPR